MPDGRIVKELDLSSDDILEMSEQEFRNHVLRQDSALTEPAILAVERSVSRERERVEDYLEPESGPEKWIKAGDQIIPRWAEVVSELHHREEYADTYDVEVSYRNAVQEDLERTRELYIRLGCNPCDQDIIEYVHSFRGMEQTYEQEVKSEI